jgi:MOSC domain-containing protein YiiM
MNETKGKVLKLFITQNDENKTRLEKQSVTLDKDGILQDKFYAKNLQRSVLITSIQSYELAQQNGIDIEYGTLGENILVDINPYDLLPGQHFSIGNTMFEITQNCTICKGLTIINNKLPKLLKDDRGVFAKVLSDNTQIKVGDTITL